MAPGPRQARPGDGVRRPAARGLDGRAPDGSGSPNPPGPVAGVDPAEPGQGAEPVDAPVAADGRAAADPRVLTEVRNGCTAAQMRRFIKSRTWVPLHELRRRFAIDGGEDVVVPVDLEAGRIFVGLPAREGGQLAELLRSGDIGYELSLDPVTPVVIGVYPMRPVARG